MRFRTKIHLKIPNINHTSICGVVKKENALLLTTCHDAVTCQFCINRMIKKEIIYDKESETNWAIKKDPMGQEYWELI